MSLWRCLQELFNTAEIFAPPLAIFGGLVLE